VAQAEWAAHLVNACGAVGDLRRRAGIRFWHLNGDTWLRIQLLQIAATLAGRSRLRAWWLARRTRRSLAESDADSEYWGDLVDVFMHAARALRNVIPDTRSPRMRRRNELLQLTRMLEVKSHEALLHLPGQAEQRGIALNELIIAP